MHLTRIAILASMLTVSQALPAGAKDMDPLVPSITVVGTGKVSVKPDMAEIQVGVVSQAPSAAKALKENSEAMARLLKTLTARGIADKDVQTSNFNVTPTYERTPQGVQRARIAGYQVSNQVHVRIHELAQLGEVLDDVVSEGANQVHGISFTLADPERILDEARQKAMADALRKAKLYAQAAEVTVGPVLLVQEQAPHVPGPRFVSLAADAARAVPIAPGEREFQASITVTYTLR